MSIALTNQDVAKELLDLVRSDFSRYAYISSVNEKTSEAKIGIQIQELIPDYKTEQTTIRVVALDDVANLVWAKRGGRIKIRNPTRTDFVDGVKHHYLNKVRQSQTILLPTVYQRLVEVPHVIVAMSPLRKILMQIDDNGQIAPNELGGKRTDSKIRKYFGLLEDLEFVKPEDGHFVAGARMRNLQAGEVKPQEVFRTILAEVMQKKAKYLRDVLHWTMMVPYLQWCNTYYFPAYEAGHLVKTERDYLIQNYRRFYETIHLRSAETDEVQQVVDAELLTKDHTMYEGTREVFDAYAHRMDSENVLESPTMLR